jgi:NAD(P)-dependent dehydrogenase (short-subunit alcohol dehydrogenase family)
VSAAPPLALTGRVAVVTGAVEGIGWATAQVLAAEGAAVALVGRVADDRLDVRVEQLSQDGADVVGIASDVTDAPSVTACYRQVLERWGRLDILVANAGVLGDARIGMISEDLLRTTLETNLAGAIRHLQAGARLMQRDSSSARSWAPPATPGRSPMPPARPGWWAPCGRPPRSSPPLASASTSSLPATSTPA